MSSSASSLDFDMLRYRTCCDSSLSVPGSSRGTSGKTSGISSGGGSGAGGSGSASDELAGSAGIDPLVEGSVRQCVRSSPKVTVSLKYGE